MKKALTVGLIIGVILGFLQIFFVRTTLTKNGYFLGNENCKALTAECGYCPGLKEDNICYTDGVYQRYRGFPLTSKSGGSASSVKLGLALYANMLIFIVGIPLIFLILYIVFSRRKRKSRAKTHSVEPPDESSESV